MSFQLAPPLPGLYPQPAGDLPPALPQTGQRDAGLAGRWLSVLQQAKPHIPEENPWAAVDKSEAYSPDDTLKMWMAALGYDPGPGRLPRRGSAQERLLAVSLPLPGGPAGPGGPGGPPSPPDQSRDRKAGELPAREPEGAWSEVPYRPAVVSYPVAAGYDTAGPAVGYEIAGPGVGSRTAGSPAGYGSAAAAGQAASPPVYGDAELFPGGGGGGGVPAGAVSRGGTTAVGGTQASPAPGASLAGWSSEYYPQGASEVAVESPAGAVAYMLKERGIHPESPIGKLYMDKAPELLVAYKLYAGQAGQPANDKTLFMSFVKGYMDMALSKDPMAWEQLAKLRGVLKAQVKIGLEDPNTQLGAAIRDLADPRMGGSPERLWQGVFQPALEATAAPALYQQAKKGQYYRLYRAWTEHQVRAAVNNQKDNMTFPDFLAQAGFEV